MLLESGHVPVVATPGRTARWHVASLGGAAVFSALVVVGARLWYDTFQRIWPTQDDTLEGLQFGSFLVVLGVVLTLVWRGDVGLRIARTVPPGGASSRSPPSG